MNVIERPRTELGDYLEDRKRRLQARQAIQEVVLGTLDWRKAEASLFSGFNGNCVNDEGVYTPTAKHIKDSTLYAAIAYDWAYRQQSGLADIGHWATNYEAPAVGVYDLEQFVAVKSLQWQVKEGLTIPETCTDIFVWR